MAHLHGEPTGPHPHFGSIIDMRTSENIKDSMRCGNCRMIYQVSQARAIQSYQHKGKVFHIRHTGAVGECPFCHSEKVGKL